MKYVFDLKGSLIGRYVNPPFSGKTLKDLNFLQINKQSKVNYSRYINIYI